MMPWTRQACWGLRFRRDDAQGFSLIELVVTVGILVLVMVGLFRLFLYSSSFAEMAGSMSRAVASAQDKVEQVRNTPFASIVSNYAGTTFDLTNPTGKGQVSIDSSNANLLKLTVKISFQHQNQRVVGEDMNLNGILDAGEDINGNGLYDTPVDLVTLISAH